MVKPSYRLDQIGSLTRPAPLLDARDAYHGGKIGLTELRQTQERQYWLHCESKRKSA